MGETASTKKNSPLRVLHCVVGMNVGGYETLIMNLFRHIDREKVCFDFVVSQDGVFDNEIRELGGKIFKIPFITEVGPFVYARELRRVFLQKPQYSIVHSHMDKFSGMVVREAYKCGIPVRIAHAHNTQNEGGILFRAVKNYYGTFIHRYVTDRFACSGDAAIWMFKEDARQTRILNNGIELERFKPNADVRVSKRRELGITNSLVIGNIARFTTQKNHAFLLKVFSEILMLKPNAKLMLVGDGPLREQMQTQAQALGIVDKVLFMGIRKDVNDLLQAMDVFVFPSLHEGFGNVLIEAQAANVPCVVSDVIPKEAFATNGITSLSLSAPIRTWVERILTMRNVFFECQGLEPFDITKVAKKIQEFYIDYEISRLQF